MEIRLPPDQEARLTTLAASAGRTSDEIVQEALSLWEERQANELRQAATPNHTLQQAGIRELRKGNRLPEGETIKGLINYGRA
jgi:predicted transcriptional regulator